MLVEAHDGQTGLRLIPRWASGMARPCLLRHLAICIATICAWAMRRELYVTGGLLWVLGLAAIVNAAAARLPDIPKGVGRFLSPSVGLMTWAALVFLTGGVSSPMVAGLWLEIVFAAMVFPPPATLLTTAAAIGVLSADQCALGLGSTLGRLGLQAGFLLSFGLVAFSAKRRWRQEHQALSIEATALGSRLIDLERELEAARVLGRVGERVARLAHSLKNAVHSLRGFVKLMEVPANGDRAQAQAQVIAGLQLAIDRLEQTAREVLRPSEGQSQSDGTTTAAELSRTLDEVVAEMRRIHSGVHWIKAPLDNLRSVALPALRLREVLLILAQNAAEACGASGEVIVRAHVVGDLLHLVVQDRGPGFDPLLRDAIFQPGITSKPTGNGFGLFLARRLVEAGGGRLTIHPAGHGGALVSVRLPVLSS